MSAPRRSKFLRTPEGAWYNGYAGLRPPNAFDYYGYLGPAPAASSQERDAAVVYGASHAAYLPPASDDVPNSDAAMAKYYEGGAPHSYRAKDDFGKDDVRHLPADFKLYDPYSRNNNGNNNSGDFGMDFSSKPYDPHPPAGSRNGGVDFGGKSCEPYHHNGPAVHYGSSPPRDGGGGFGDATGAKQSYVSPRVNNGPTERDWELPARLSPRRMHYEPSFHDPGASPRNNAPPPWERERGQCRSPILGPADGQGLEKFDPRAGKGTTMALKQAPSKHAGSVFLFIRFHVDCVAVIGQACQAALTRDLRGEFVGIADEVYDFGDQPGRNRNGYAVFQFPSLKSAEVFYNRDRHFRQPDFPRPFGDIEVFAVELQTDPIAVKSFNTFVLSEVTLNDGLGAESLRHYEDSFKTPFTQALLRLGALPYAAFCDRNTRRTLKRRYFDRNDLVTLHLYRSVNHYKHAWGDWEYSDLRGTHDTQATEKTSVFKVRPEYT